MSYANKPYPSKSSKNTLVSLKGPGLFISALVSKQGGATGMTFVMLEVDGRALVSIAFAGSRNIGLTVPNPYGLQIVSGIGIETMTIGWPFPLTFKTSLTLRAEVTESGVVQIVGHVLHASSG